MKRRVAAKIHEIRAKRLANRLMKEIYLLRNYRDGVFGFRDTLPLDEVLASGNIELMKIFLANLQGRYGLRSLRSAYHEVLRHGEEVHGKNTRPINLVTEHGMEMRNLISTELVNAHTIGAVEIISVFAMGLAEYDARRVVAIAQRGILDIDRIRELLAESDDLPRPLSEGIL